MIDQGEHRALQKSRRIEFHRDPAPNQLHQFQHDVGQTKSHQQFRHVTHFVNLAQHLTFKYRTGSTRQYRRQKQSRPETEDTAERIAEISPQHVKTGVGEIEYAHHAEDQRQA